MTANLGPRFWSKVRRGGDDECWPWTGAHDGRGYGSISVEGRRMRASQVAWSITFGVPFPDGLVACHTCDNPSCCNPKHIWPGTMRQNMMDAARKGRIRLEPMMAVNANAVKTHCKRGHSLDGDNLIIDYRGDRRCRTCQREHVKNYQSKAEIRQRRTKQEAVRRARAALAKQESTDE